MKIIKYIYNFYDKEKHWEYCESDIFDSYRKFTLIDNYFWEKYSGQYYFFTFPVMKKHSEIIAEQLFNYLLRYLENTKQEEGIIKNNELILVIKSINTGIE